MHVYNEICILIILFQALKPSVQKSRHGIFLCWNFPFKLLNRPRKHFSQPIRQLWYQVSSRCFKLPLVHLKTPVPVCSTNLSPLSRVYVLSYKEFRIPRLDWLWELVDLTHMTPVLRDLHWLPIPARLAFKILLLTHKCLRNEGPSSLRELLKFCNPSCPLRSSMQSLLQNSYRLNTLYYEERAFSLHCSKVVELYTRAY